MPVGCWGPGSSLIQTLNFGVSVCRISSRSSSRVFSWYSVFVFSPLSNNNSNQCKKKKNQQQQQNNNNGCNFNSAKINSCAVPLHQVAEQSYTQFTYNNLMMALKGAIRITNFLQHVCWSGQGAIVRKSRALGVHHLQYAVCYMAQRDSSAIKFDGIYYSSISLAETINQ